ncbi:hypothetical protein ACEQ8H_004361 [Pleosporales sp. CAS-2024a]
MAPSFRVPLHLEPYIRLPRDDSLLLLTSTLGASANWLTILFLCDALRSTSSTSSREEEEDGGADPGHNVVLVSWMREYDFWKQEARKSGGIDLDGLKRQGRFIFVDGLRSPCVETTTTTGTSSRRGGGGGGAITTTLPSLLHPTHVQNTLTAVLSSPPLSPHRKSLLVLDNPDLLLALTPALPSPPNNPSTTLPSLILKLHALPAVSHVLTHIQADTPLLGLSTPPQPLQVAQHNFLVKMAHMSRRIVGVRVLDTGVARDVSGVVRVTEMRMDWRGIGQLGEKEQREGAAGDGRGKEFLYQVKGDGSVRVFERGAAGEDG